MRSTLALTGMNHTLTLARCTPKGAAACDGLIYWLNGMHLDPATREPYDALTAGTTMAVDAVDATTPSIRAAVTKEATIAGANRLQPTIISPGSFRFLDPERLHAACRDAGIELPEYTSKPKAA